MISSKCIIFLLVIILNGIDSKGSSGGSRGSSGARSSSSSFSSRSSSSSSSSYSGSSRSGGGYSGGSSYRSNQPSSSLSSSSYSSPSRSSSSSLSYSSSRSTNQRDYRSGSPQYNSNFRSNVFHTTTTTTMFTYSPLTHTHVIISPITPIYYGSYHYYWGGHYVADTQRPEQCEYTITDDDQELRNVTFQNGTKPTTLTFGCKRGEECCGLECCSNGSTVIWIIVVIAAIIFLCILCSWCQKRGYCESDTTIVTSIPVVHTTTTTMSYQVPPPGPPPPQFCPPSAPPMYSQAPVYPAYDQNFASYDVRPTSVSHIHAQYNKQ